MSLPPSTPQNNSYGRTAGIGAIWIMGSTFIAKAASFLSQLVLGWLLSQNDFGIYAMAISISSIAAAIQHGGADRILIQQGHRYRELARPILKLTFGLKLATATIISLIAPFAASSFGSQEVALLLWVIAGNIFINAPILIYRAKLTIDLRFRSLAQLNSWSAIIRYGSMISFAVAGLGPLSFVLPLLLVTVFEAVYLRLAVGPIPSDGQNLCRVLPQITSASIWIVTTAIGGAMVLNGDYLIIGSMMTQDQLGVYFFGYQLIASFNTLVASGLTSVLMPSFTKLINEPVRERAGFIKALKLMSLVFAPICAMILITAAPLVHLAWAGRWDAAIPIVQVLAIAFAANMIAPLTASITEAHGRWRLRACTVMFSGLTTMVAAYIGAWFGEIVYVAIAIGIQRVLMGLINTWIASRLTGCNYFHTLVEILPPFAIAMVCGGTAWSLSAFIFEPISQVTVCAAVFVTLWVILSRMLLWSRIQHMLHVFIPPSEKGGNSK